VSAAVDLPRSTEAVFQTIERDDEQIVKMLGDAAGFQILRGLQGICDRSSASCVLHANNILAKVESYLEYVPKLKIDLKRQGYKVTVEHVEPTVRVPSSEAKTKKRPAWLNRQFAWVVLYIQVYQVVQIVKPLKWLLLLQ
jgi:hypothetical protein